MTTTCCLSSFFLFAASSLGLFFDVGLGEEDPIRLLDLDRPVDGKSELSWLMHSLALCVGHGEDGKGPGWPGGLDARDDVLEECEGA